MWDHQPSAAQLLAERLRRGWKPTPSRLKTGDEVLGYAACAVTGAHRTPPAFQNLSPEASEGLEA